MTGGPRRTAGYERGRNPGNVIFRSRYYSKGNTGPDALLAICLMMVASFPGLSTSAEERFSPEEPAEFLIHQGPGAYLVIRTDARETEFESHVYAPDRTLLIASSVPGRRIGPVFQFITAAERPRQLVVKLIPARPIGRPEISMELLRFTVDDRNSAPLMQAYRLLSQGTETTRARDTTTWAVKTYTLKKAASAFAALGMEEMRLWAEFYAAHTAAHGLGDELTAVEFARDVRQAARTGGFDTVRLAALQLEGDSLFRIGASQSGPTAADRLESAHEILGRTAALARELGFPAEQARALYRNAVAYELQNQLSRALELYEQAVAVSLQAGDQELANEARRRAASAYTRRGDTNRAITLLEDISSDLEKRNAALELAASLYEKGMLLNDSSRFAAAAEVLSRALELQKSARAGVQWGPTGLELARAQYESGYFDHAVRLILESAGRTAMSQNAGEMRSAYGRLANIFRAQGRFGLMQRYREEQRSLAVSDGDLARVFLDQGIDALHGPDGGPDEAATLFGRSERLAQQADDLLAARASLYGCLAAAESGARTPCGDERIVESHARLKSGGTPVLSVEADYLRARIRWRSEQLHAAVRGMEALLKDLHLLGTSLSGVLGGWFWENRETLFSQYLSMILASQTGRPDDMQTAVNYLTALEQSREIERLAVAGRGTDVAPVFAEKRRAANAESIRRLAGSLQHDQSLLTFHLSRQQAHALIAARGRIHRVGLARPRALQALLLEIRSDIADSRRPAHDDLEALGRMLLSSVSGWLTRRVYLVPAGALNGFPFDLLRLDAQFLAERYQVVNLQSVLTLERPGAELTLDADLRVFLAGNPQIRRELFRYEEPASEEIRAVTDRFVGPGLHIVQGTALRRDEFDDRRFREAGLLHMGIPGVVDLAFPGRSRLLLAGPSSQAAHELLPAPEIGGYTLEGRLAVLSALKTENRSAPFSTTMGVVRDFQAAGVPAVIASLWPLDDALRARFARDFYRNLASEANVAHALWLTRREWIGSDDAPARQNWAALQLYR